MAQSKKAHSRNGKTLNAVIDKAVDEMVDAVLGPLEEDDTDDNPTPQHTGLIIKPLNQEIVAFHLRSTAPYMQHRFSQKAKAKMMETQRQGSQARSKKTREPRNFEEDYRQAMHVMKDGKCGIPCGGFRNGMISACRTAGYQMSKAKLAIFIMADGYDVADGTPLIRLQGTPEINESPVRNETGVIDIRSRPMWREWGALLRVRFDADLFSATDVLNLVVRMGAQVGIGEGRPDSKRSNGIDFGLFEVVNGEEVYA